MRKNNGRKKKLHRMLKVFSPGELQDKVVNARRSIGILMEPEHRRMLECIAEKYYRVNSFSHAIRLMTIDTFNVMVKAGIASLEDLRVKEQRETEEVIKGIGG